MAIPLTVHVGERGTGGVPNMAGRVDSLGKIITVYEHTIAHRYGYESMRCSWDASCAEALAWGRHDHLMRPCEVYDPSAEKVWEGFLFEIKVTLGRLTFTYSLANMANRMLVRYSSPDGKAGVTSAYSNAESIALYGVKERLKKLSGTLAAGAADRAQTEVNDTAFPKSGYPSEGGGSGSTTSCSVQLTFKGWGETLDWLMTSNASASSVSITTQVAALIVAYNGTNNWFSTATTTIETGLPSDTEGIEENTTYREKFDKLLAIGNSSHKRLHWGFYDDRQLVVRTAASATPDVIGYYEDLRTKEVTDANGNIVPVWKLRPDVMVQMANAVDVDVPAGAVDAPFRKYVARVTCRITEKEPTYTLEPADVENFDSLLTSPVGQGAAGNSARQASIERTSAHATKSSFAATDNPNRYDGATGVWKPKAGGTGKPNDGTLDVPSDGTLDLGGTKISNSGGNDVDVGTGDGIGGTGSSGVSTPSAGGTIGLIPQWTAAKQLGDSTLKKTGAGLLELAAASPAVLTIDSSTRIAGAGASASQVLAWNGTAYAPTTLTPSSLGAIDGSGTAGRVAQFSDADTIGDSTLAKTGGGLLTFAASSPATLTIDSSIRLTGSGATSGQVLAFNGTAFAPTTLLPSDIGAIDGSGTAGRLAQFSDADTITAATLAKSGGGVLTLSAGSTATLTIDSSIRLTGSGATSGQALVYNGTAFAPTTLAASDLSAAPDDATYIVKTANSGLSNEFALSTLPTGLLKVTTTTGALTTATASDLPNHASRHQNGGADELALDGGQITTGTVAAGRLGSGTSITTKFLRGDNSWQTINTGVGGSGTAGRVMQWASGGADAENSTLAKTGAGVLTLSAASAYTLTINSSGSLNLKTGSITILNTGQDVVIGGTVSGGTYGYIDFGNGNDTVKISGAGLLGMNANYLYVNQDWILGSYSAGGTVTPTGRISFSINGANYVVAAQQV